MKGYLQRLTDRAQGVSMTPSIVPAGHSLITREPGSDPFTSDQPTESLIGPTRSPRNVHDSLIGPNAEMGQPSGMFRGNRRSWRSESAETEAGPETAKSASRSRAETIQPPLLDEKSSPAPRHIEPGHVRLDTAEQWTEVNAKSTLLSPTQDTAKPFATQPLDKATQVVAPSTLEPRTPDSFRPQIPPPEEPRLVIGQLRVDVIPTPSSQRPEVVRTITRTVGPNQTRTASRPISKLRFGLGQM